MDENQWLQKMVVLVKKELEKIMIAEQGAEQKEMRSKSMNTEEMSNIVVRAREKDAEEEVNENQWMEEVVLVKKELKNEVVDKKPEDEVVMF